MKFKRILRTVLAFCCIAGMLAGCGNKTETLENTGTETPGEQAAQGSGATGRFMESELTLPQEDVDIHAMGKLADGSIAVLAEQAEAEKGYLFCSKDSGESFETTELSAPLNTSWLCGAAIARDGTAVAAGYFMDIEDGGRLALKTITPDGAVTSVPLELPEPQMEGVENILRQLAFDSGGNLIGQDLEGTILWIDPALGTYTKTLSCEERVSYFGVVDDKLLCVTESGIRIYGTADGEELSPDDVLSEVILKNTSLAHSSSTEGLPLMFGAGMGQDDMLYVNTDGIYTHSMGGSVSEQLVSGELSSLKAGEMQFVSLVMAGEKDILLHAVGSDGDKVLRYHYDESVPAVPEKELKVYALRDTSLLRQGILLYQKQNPNVFVNLQIGMTGEDGVTAEDAVKALNTELLAGNVPDVLVLDGLPTDSYIEKGILADISEVVDTVSTQDGVFENVVGAYRGADGCYRVPARFYVGIVIGEPEAVAAGASLPGFADFMEAEKAKSPDDNMLPAQTARELLQTMYEMSGAGWFAENGLDEEGLTEWLDAAGRIYAADNHKKDASGTESGEELIGTAGSAALGILMKENRMGLDTASSMSNLADILEVTRQMGGSYGLFAADQVHSFVPYLELGMSSTAQPEAKDFILTLLGKEAGSTDDTGYPVNRAGWQELCAKSIELYGADSTVALAMSNEEGELVSLNYNHMTQEVCDAFEKLLESVDTPAPTDEVMEQFILDEAERYVLGETSLEDAVGAINQKVKLYLAE